MGRNKGYYIQRNIAKTKPKVIASPMPTIRFAMGGAGGLARVRFLGETFRLNNYELKTFF